MSKFVQIDTNLDSVQKDVEKWPKDAKKAAANTLNKVVRKGNKAIKDHIKKNYNFKKVGSITRRVSIGKADARESSIVSRIYIKEVGRGLGLYSPIQRKRKGKRKGPVSVKVKSTRKTLRHGAFVSTWSGDNVAGNSFMKGATVFRKGTGRHAGTVTRISKSGKAYTADKREMRFGPNVAQLYRSRRARKILNDTVAEFYPKMFDEDFGKRLAKKKAKIK